MGYFNADEEEKVVFDVLPPGWYRALVNSISEEVTKDGTGKYIAVEMQVVEAPHESRKFYFKFNLENANEKAQKIGRGQFAVFAIAAGSPVLDTVDDLQKMVGCPMVVKVKVRKGDNGYNDQNEFVQAFSPESYDDYLKNDRAKPAGRSGTQRVAPAAKQEVPI